MSNILERLHHNRPKWDLNDKYIINTLITEHNHLNIDLIETLQYFIKKGKSLNEADPYGTPLHRASHRFEILEYRIPALTIIQFLLQQPQIDIYKRYKYYYNSMTHVYKHLIYIESYYDKTIIPPIRKMIQMHALIDYIMTLVPLGLTSYLIIWMLSWITEFDFDEMDELKKIRLIDKIKNIHDQKFLIKSF